MIFLQGVKTLVQFGRVLSRVAEEEGGPEEIALSSDTDARVWTAQELADACSCSGDEPNLDDFGIKTLKGRLAEVRTYEEALRFQKRVS